MRLIDILYEKVKIRLYTKARKGERVRKNNKRFVRNVIIISIVGLITLMVVLYVALQSYLGKQNNQGVYSENQDKQVLAQTVELSETLSILIEKISDTHILGHDIHNNEVFSQAIDKTVKVSDAYGNIFPINQLKSGDLVEISYQKQKDKVISVSKSSSLHSWNKVSGVTVDQENKTVNIAGTIYEYKKETMIIDSQGKLVDISKIGPFDIVSIQAVDNIIWSITIDKASASLNLMDLPTHNGQIEIDNSRLLMFKDVTEPIKLTSGKHKLVIKMKGYISLVKEIEVGENEVYELSLKDAEIAYTTIKPYISVGDAQYTITVGNKVYEPNQEIKVPQGPYRVEVNAEGYKKWIKNVNLNDFEWILKPLMIPIEEETEENTEELTGQTSTNDSSTNNEALNSSRTVTINSEPTGANVYIDGAHKGVTPYTVTLNNGTYGILLEQSGYDVYSTNILLDGSNDQTSYLYKLIPREE